AEQGHIFATWTIPQLAAFLVSFGFDCSESVFQRFGYNICGYGRKTNIPTDKSFMFHQRFKFFPPTFSELLRPNNDLWQNVEYADKDKIVRTNDVFNLQIPGWNSRS
ncbi:MAG: hypothetical protein LBS35_08950, partial [Synergistaceae bacterium]|nr:hypothetical protein [Synergistaceae bacterium]